MYYTLYVNIYCSVLNLIVHFIFLFYSLFCYHNTRFETLDLNDWFIMFIDCGHRVTSYHLLFDICGRSPECRLFRLCYILCAKLYFYHSWSLWCYCWGIGVSLSLNDIINHYSSTVPK